MREKLKPKIGFFGDSFVQGFGVNSQYNWVSLVSREYPSYSCINYGKNGLLSRELLPLLRQSLKEEEFSAIVILCGLNDLIGGGSVEEVAQNFYSMENECKKRLASFFLLIPPIPMWRDEPILQSHIMARSLQEKIIALNSIFKNRALILSDVFANHEHMFFDGIHFNEEGHKVLAQAFISHWEKSRIR